jgi:hypothetical protein
MEIEKANYDRIAAEIHSDQSPVGIDAKKTHILILHKLEQIQQQLDDIQRRVTELEK